MSDRLRVVAVADVSPVVVLGGGERVLSEEASRLAARGHRVTVISRAPAEERGAARGTGGTGSVHGGVALRHFPVRRGSLPAFLCASLLGARRAVQDEVRARGADVLYLHQPLSGAAVLTSPELRRIPAVYTFHSPAALEYRWRGGTTPLHRRGVTGRLAAAVIGRLERACVERASRVRVLSDFSATLLDEMYGLGADRVVTVPGGVDVDRFRPAPDRDAVRARLGLPAGQPLVFTLRNLTPRMGLDTLIRAVAAVRRSMPELRLAIGGDGPLRGALDALARSLGLERQVTFLGHVPDDLVAGYYQAADVFVLPTRALEGFGLVTVEALACGTPVLGTPVGATPEILGRIDPGLVLGAATEEAVATGLARFFAEAAAAPERVAGLRERCRMEAVSRYAWAGVVDRVEALLIDVAEGGRERACPACGTRAFRPGPLRHGTRSRVCAHCGTASAHRVATAAELRTVYDGDYAELFPPERIAPERLQLFASLLGRLGPPEHGARLLDVGCGGGHLLAAAAAAGWRVVGSDVSHAACVAASKGSGRPVVHADATALPFRGGSLDAVTLVNVLDLLRAPDRVLAEVHRVLRPGGALVVRVPNGAFHRTCIRVIALAPALARWLAVDHCPVQNVHSFTSRGLYAIAAGAGFDRLAVRNSPFTASGPSWRRAGAAGVRRPLGAVIAVVTSLVERLSCGRWQMAPSVELTARRPESAVP